MTDDALVTADRIILAASELFQEKGFHPVTMKNIACRANVSEMTVFRHFSSKKQVLEAVIKKISYIPPLKEVFEDKICWDLETDLLLISETYQKIMADNQLAFLITLREEKTIPEVSQFIRQGPPQFKSFLKTYFGAMQDKKQIGEGDTESLALAFMAINFGYFFFKICGHEMVGISDEQYLKTAIELFAKGIKT
ncbi:tetr bacterial regulatory protein hth signature [Lucifera butyrica]|uniref:Tetr bacterial regulatory protein hth signature n=1 Tax=Lucifera butyrica TaxID=1351585 RepID=A0A498RDJ1_9FIRM|nr:TetR/AcrR family transcriptional regulator [Lucifera butyrica]VBB09541.1 tetr bacterial regulatory protein hth signature [Lucifera butyrica]